MRFVFHPQGIWSWLSNEVAVPCIVVRSASYYKRILMLLQSKDNIRRLINKVLETPKSTHACIGRKCMTALKNRNLFWGKIHTNIWEERDQKSLKSYRRNIIQRNHCVSSRCKLIPEVTAQRRKTEIAPKAAYHKIKILDRWDNHRAFRLPCCTGLESLVLHRCQWPRPGRFSLW